MVRRRYPFVEGDSMSFSAGARAERAANRDERASMLARIAELEASLRKSERARAVLRATLTEERHARAEDTERHEESHRITCAALARYARVAGAPGWRCDYDAENRTRKDWCPRCRVEVKR